MTGKERIARILKRQPVDRIGLFEHFWGDTLKKWQDEGHIQPHESLEDHFGFDMSLCWCFNTTVDIHATPIVLEETEDTILTKDGNGAILRKHKKHSATPEHVDFTVKDRQTWEEFAKPYLYPTRERINLESYRQCKEYADQKGRFFCWSGVNVFEMMHPLCGHQHMLMGMALDPDWVRDMVEVYSNLLIGLLEILFAEAGKPDGIWFYEDMGFKHRPFMSLTMYREIIQPAHQRTIDFCHHQGLPVIMHSCGYIEPLLPGMVEAGIDALQVIEVKAGMDLLKIYHEYGNQIALCGGMDARNLVANDLQAIREELHTKIPVVKEGYGYILHSDHSIPTTTNYETYRFFVEEGLRLGTY